MSYGRAKTRVRALINRKDFTDQLAGDFILDAMSSLERELRIGPMETLFEKADWDGTRNAFPVPGNFLEMVRLFTDEGALEEVDIDTFLRTRSSPVPGVGIYARIADRWLLKPTPAVGQYVYLHFYGETVRPSTDDDSTVWTEAGFLATVYRAAELAADFYQMEPDQVASYRNRASLEAEKIAGQALNESWSGRLAIGAPKGVGEY